MVKRKVISSSWNEPDSSKKIRLCDRIIDEDGDLKLRVTQTRGDSNYEGVDQWLLVTRHVLCLSSKVFKAMLSKDSPFMESAGNAASEGAGREIPTVSLLDDDYFAMVVLMNVIHMKGGKIPEELNFCELCSMAVLCDKYDLRSSLGHWPEVWARRCVEQSLDSHDIMYCRQWLTIANAFGFYEVLLYLVQYLVFHGSVRSADGELFDAHGFSIGDSVPEAILGNMSRMFVMDKIC